MDYGVGRCTCCAVVLTPGPAQNELKVIVKLAVVDESDQLFIRWKCWWVLLGEEESPNPWSYPTPNLPRPLWASILLAGTNHMYNSLLPFRALLHHPLSLIHASINYIISHLISHMTVTWSMTSLVTTILKLTWRIKMECSLHSATMSRL